MKLLLFHIFMGRKTENTIGVMSKTLRFVESKELEESTFVFFQFKFELDCVVGVCALEGLDAGVILPDETLELSGTIG